MQKTQTIESPAYAKTRVTDRLKDEFDDKCIQFNKHEYEGILNRIRVQFEKDMRAAIESSDSSKLDKALKNANVMAAATLLELDPCSMTYDSFKVLTQNKCGQNAKGDCALQLSAYNDLSKQFNNKAKNIFLTNFLHEISAIAEAFKYDIKRLEEEKKLEQVKLEQEEKAKDQKAINDLSDLDNIFTNRIGRGFFKLFGGGRPSLQNILTEIGLENIQGYISIDEAKPKLIEKFKDPKTAQLAFKAACDNKFNATTFDEMKEINDKNSQLIDLAQKAIYENKKLKEENQEMTDKISKYEKQFQEIQEISTEEFTKERIDIILNKSKVIQEHNACVISEQERLMNEFDDRMVKLDAVMKTELAKQADTLQEKLKERSKEREQAANVNVKKVNYNRPQSSKSSQQNQAIDDFYNQGNSPRPRSRDNLHVQDVVKKRRNSLSQSSPRRQ